MPYMYEGRVPGLPRGENEDENYILSVESRNFATWHVLSYIIFLIFQDVFLSWISPILFQLSD